MVNIYFLQFYRNGNIKIKYIVKKYYGAFKEERCHIIPTTSNIMKTLCMDTSYLIKKTLNKNKNCYLSYYEDSTST